MAIIVDKIKKRKEIANSCKDLLIKEGFFNITISKITQTAGISKGSFYDYFKNKEDLIFEILEQMIKDYNKKLEDKVKKQGSTKNKIKSLTAFFYKDEFKNLREIYAQFAAIALIENDEKIAKFQRKNNKFYIKWLEEIIKEGIKNNEIDINALNLVDGIFTTIKGYFISFKVMQRIDELENEINNFLDNLFKLIEVKNEKKSNINNSI